MAGLNQKLIKKSVFLTSNLFSGQKWNKSGVVKKWGKVGAYPSYVKNLGGTSFGSFYIPIKILSHDVD